MAAVGGRPKSFISASQLEQQEALAATLQPFLQGSAAADHGEDTPDLARFISASEGGQSGFLSCEDDSDASPLVAPRAARHAEPALGGPLFEEEGDEDAAGPHEEVEADEDEDATALAPCSTSLPPPKMSILILVVGTRGDVQPFVELGRRLQEDGHRARLATHDVYRDLVRSGGLEFYPLGGDPRKLSQFMCQTGGRLMPNILRKEERDSIDEKMEMLREMMFATWPAAHLPEPDVEGAPPFLADAVVANPVAYGHVHVAEKLDVPVHLMFPQPWTPTEDFPHPLSVSGRGCGREHFRPPRNSAVGLVRRQENRASYFGIDAFMYQGQRFMTNDFRRSMELQPIRAGENGAHIVTSHRVPFAYQWSPTLLPRPADYGPHLEVTGTIFNDAVSDYEPPEDLRVWLQEGEKPIFVGFGSMVVEHPDELAAVIEEAARETGTRVVLQSSWTSFGGGAEEGDERLIFPLGNCPHDWLFQQVAAVVHHGGAGTAAAGARAGKPTMICPFFGDQHLWAQALFRAGCAVEPLPIEKLTSEALASRFLLLRGLGDKGAELLRRAREVGELMACEDGVVGAKEAFYRQLPREGLACDVSLMLGPACDIRMARWYCPHLGLKVCHEAYSAILRALPEEERGKCAFEPYRHSMCWGFAEPGSVGQGLRQGVTTAAVRYAQAGAGLITTPVSEGYSGYCRDGVLGGLRGVLRGAAQGVGKGVYHVRSGTERIVTRPLQAWRSQEPHSPRGRVRRAARGRAVLGGEPKSATCLLLQDAEEERRLLRAFCAAHALHRAWTRRPPAHDRSAERAAIHWPLGISEVMEVLAELPYPPEVRADVCHRLLGGAHRAAAGGGAAADNASAAGSRRWSEAAAFVQAVKVVPYSVLGTQLRRDQSVVAIGDAPDELTAVLDSAGHGVLVGGPKVAGGAAMAIYKWAGIDADVAYAEDVKAALRHAGTAKYHSYASRQVIHAFGPDLRVLEAEHVDEALQQLAGAYRASLTEFAASGLPALRLLPISGGTRAGPFGPRMPWLTADALKLGFARLPAEQRAAVLTRRAELCVFAEADADAFRGALRGVDARPPERGAGHGRGADSSDSDEGLPWHARKSTSSLRVRDHLNAAGLAGLLGQAPSSRSDHDLVSFEEVAFLLRLAEHARGRPPRSPRQERPRGRAAHLLASLLAPRPEKAPEEAAAAAAPAAGGAPQGAAAAPRAAEEACDGPAVDEAARPPGRSSPPRRGASADGASADGASADGASADGAAAAAAGAATGLAPPAARRGGSADGAAAAAGSPAPPRVPLPTAPPPPPRSAPCSPRRAAAAARG